MLKVILVITGLLLICCYNYFPSGRVIICGGDSRQSYSITTNNSEYLLVMKRNVEHWRTFAEYPQSGLYRNDGSKTPIWTINGYGDAILSSDGAQLIRFNSYAGYQPNFSDEALTFFANGRMLQTYRVRDLIDLPRSLPSSYMGYQWLQRYSTAEGATTINTFYGSQPVSFNSGLIFDEQAGTLKLQTVLGDEYLFNTRTGEIISAWHPVRAIFYLLLGFYIIYLWRMTRQIPEPLADKFHRLVVNALLPAVVMMAIYLVGFIGSEIIDIDPGRGPLAHLFYNFPYQLLLALREINPLGYYIYTFHQVPMTILFWSMMLLMLLIANHSIVWGVATIRAKYADNDVDKLT